MVDFPKGINVKTIETKFGDIISVGINLNNFGDNPSTESGWVNFSIKKSKNGTWYAELYSKKEDLGGKNE